MTSEELKRLSYFKEKTCRDRCEKTGNCFDCFIEFEDVKAIEHLLKEYEKLKSKLELYENGVYYSSEVDELQNKIDKAIDYINEYAWQEDWVGNTCDGKPMKDRYMRLEWDNCNELLDILKGEENDSNV